MVAKYGGLDAALAAAGGRIDSARQTLYYCDVAFNQKSPQHLRHVLHASTYVYVAAAMEAFLRESCEGLVEEINGSGVLLKDLRLSLFAVVQGPRLQALQTHRGLKKWDQRAVLFQAVSSSTSCALDSAHMPIDGHTIRPSHLDALWAVLGLPGLSAPGPRHQLALTDLADNRNAVAHGDEDAAAVAGRKGVPDTLRLLDRIDEVVLHIYYAMAEYLDQQAYRR